MPSEALAEEGNSSAYPNRQRDRVESALSGRSSRPADTISRPATLLVWRSACRADERGSKPRQVATACSSVWESACLGRRRPQDRSLPR